MYSFVFLPFSTMLVSTLLSLYKTFDTKENEIDYFPTTLDKYIHKKILWYFSHFTYSNSIILLSYFTLKVFNYNCNELFVIISPISLSINLNYFIILYPKKIIKLYELPYYSLVQHFMTTFIILNELQFVEYSSNDILKYNYFIFYGVLMTFLNYNFRGVWTYGLANLYSYKGWKLFLQFNIVSLFSSISLYLLKLIY
jgi:hypothetical protein